MEDETKTSDLIKHSFATLCIGTDMEKKSSLSRSFTFGSIVEVNPQQESNSGLSRSFSFNTSAMSILEIGAQMGLSSSDSVQSNLSELSRMSNQDDSPIIEVIGYRLDYCLKHKAIKTSLRQYVTGIRAHFNYWTDKDLTYHVLSTIRSRPW
jgi:hypothetical protein